MAKKQKQPKIIDPNKPLRYVMYLRKSSEGEDAQAKSLPDQKTECQKYAMFHNLQVVEIIEESASAWISGNRPEFQRMIMATPIKAVIVNNHPMGRILSL